MQFDQVGGGVRSVGHVDARQDDDHGQENGHDPCRRGGAVVEQTGEGGFTDAFVLHLVEDLVVQFVGLLVPAVGLSGVAQQAGRPAVLASVAAGLCAQPGRMTGEAEGGGLRAVGVRVAEDAESRFALSFGDGLLGFFP